MIRCNHTWPFPFRDQATKIDRQRCAKCGTLRPARKTMQFADSEYRPEPRTSLVRAVLALVGLG